MSRLHFFDGDGGRNIKRHGRVVVVPMMSVLALEPTYAVREQLAQFGVVAPGDCQSVFVVACHVVSPVLKRFQTSRPMISLTAGENQTRPIALMIVAAAVVAVVVMLTIIVPMAEPSTGKMERL